MSETNKPRYFSYDPDCGFDTHDTAEEARSQSEESISYYRDNACDGWSEHVEGICWGVILSEVEETENRPRHEDDGCCPECDFVVDYGLTEAQDPYAELATLRAQVAELTAERDGLAKDAGRYRWLRNDMSELHNPWRQFIENCISGDNYFRASEYRQLLDQIDGWISEAAKLRAQVAELAKEAELHRAIERAAKDLPDGYHIELCVEAGCGSVQLVEPDAVSIRDMYEDDASLADQVNAAIDAAMVQK